MSIEEEFSEILYKGKGDHQRKGGTFSYVGVKSQEELDAKLAEGWHLSLEDAIQAHDNPIPKAPDNTAPTRAELEQQATELEIKFDGRTTDAKLAKLIEEALKV